MKRAYSVTSEPGKSSTERANYIKNELYNSESNFGSPLQATTS